MDSQKQAKLEAAGWKVGDISDFLELSAEDVAFIEMKMALATQLRQRRAEQQITQETFAQILGSSQSRVAKMESGHPSVSMDLLVKSLLAIGASPQEVGRTISL